MLVMPTTDTAKRISKQRLASMIQACPRLREKVAESRSRDSGNTVLMKEFAGGVLVITGANSGPGLRSMPVRYLFLDEVDAYPSDVDGEGDPVEVARKRTDTFARRKVFQCSSPKDRLTSRIAKAYEASDQRRYHVPCPHCAAEQWLKWDRIRWETRKVWEISDTSTGEVIETGPEVAGAVERDTGELVDVWYECEACEGRVEEYHKSKMLEAGRWIAGRPGGGRSPGFHLSALYSPLGWFSWWDAVRARLRADGDPTGELLKTWTNTVLGEAYDEAGDQPDDNDLKRHIGDYRVGGPVPRAVLMMTCGVDVQHDRLEARVWGWGRGEEAWLVHREVIFGPVSLDSTWDALDELLFRGWPHAGGGTLKIQATAVDASDGITTHHVRVYARKHAARHVIAVKGQAVQGKPILGRPTEQDVNHRGKTIKGGVKLWPMGSDTAKGVIYARFRITEPGPGYVHFPQGLPDGEFAELVSEKVVTRYVKGFARREWVKDPGARNEALDCFVMALAAAQYAGVTRANWDRLEALLIQPDMWAAPKVESIAPPPATVESEPPAEPVTAISPALPAPVPKRFPAGRPAGGFATRW
jgi:phage terminase large subunit GpA-like protein